MRRSQNLMWCGYSNIIPVGIDCSVIYRSTPTCSRCPDCTSYQCRCGLLHMFACSECAKLRMHCTCSAKTLLISVLNGEISTCSLHCNLVIAIIFCDVICVTFWRSLAFFNTHVGILSAPLIHLCNMAFFCDVQLCWNWLFFWTVALWHFHAWWLFSF